MHTLPAYKYANLAALSSFVLRPVPGMHVTRVEVGLSFGASWISLDVNFQINTFWAENEKYDETWMKKWNEKMKWKNSSEKMGVTIKTNLSLKIQIYEFHLNTNYERD